MTNPPTQPIWDPLVLARQLQNIAKQSQSLMQRFVSNQTDGTKIGMGDTSTLGFDFADLMTKMAADPTAVAKAQIDLFNDNLAVWQKTAARMFNLGVPEADAPKDKRFKHSDWTENAVFGFVKESYLVAAKSILSAVRDVKGMLCSTLPPRWEWLLINAKPTNTSFRRISNGKKPSTCQ